jgi:hypothetical protein
MFRSLKIFDNKNNHIGDSDIIILCSNEQLENWLEKNDIDDDLINDEYLPAAILEGIIIYDEKNRGHGYGKKAMEDFFKIGAEHNVSSFILIADKECTQKSKDFDLVEWYKRLDFESMGNVGENLLLVKFI